MFSRCATELGFKKLIVVPSRVYDHNTFVISYVSKHSVSCPTIKTKTCPGSGGVKSGNEGGSSKGVVYRVPDFKRAERSGPVRLGFIPEEWFTFFYVKTGVSGPYVFGLVLINYMLSKEIYVLEHEYYSGLSIALIVYWATTRLGPAAGASLDKEVDAVVEDWMKSRNDEIAHYDNQIKVSKEAQLQAQGQKLLMDAKKENIAMQYEAVYRERLMHVYTSTVGRMEYQVKKSQTEARVQQKWMIQWILNNVRQSITPDFRKAALQAAIQELAATAGRK